MMLQMSTLTKQILSDFDTAHADVLGDDIYPLIAPGKAAMPLAVYRISKGRNYSKKGITDIDIEIVLIGQDYDQLCGIADDLEDHINQNHPELEFLSAVSGVNPEDQEEFNITLKFNAKMI